MPLQHPDTSRARWTRFSFHEHVGAKRDAVLLEDAHDDAQRDKRYSVLERRRDVVCSMIWLFGW